MLQSIEIKPLSEETLVDAISLAQQLFPDDSLISDDSPETGFRASLQPDLYKHLYERDKLVYLQYFVILNRDTQKVIGVTGLYQHTNEPVDVVWLGWYGIDKAYRGVGLGKYLLQWTIDKAKSENKSILRLYTSDDHNTAQILYEKFGFVETGRQNKHDFTAIYKELNLRSSAKFAVNN